MQISKLLFISHGTVRNHITSIFYKTGVKNRAQLAAKYISAYERVVTDVSNLPSNVPVLPDGHVKPIAILRLIGDQNLPSAIPLIFVDDSFTIGRFDTNIGQKQCNFEFSYSTKAVSRRHAKIIRLTNGFSIVDLNSRAGTFINGTRIPPEENCMISQNDCISFGIAGADYIFDTCLV